MSQAGNKATRQQGNEAKCAGGLRHVRGRAFTLVELLVVIVVIGVLAGVILTVSGRILGHQKANTTKNTMRLVGLAIDQFAAEDPLKPVYNSRNSLTFGPYPPYQLANWQFEGANELGPDNVAGALEPGLPGGQWAAGVNYTLANRLWRDLGNGGGAGADWRDVEDGNANDDIRSLYAYLAVYSPGVLGQIPESAIKRLEDREPADPDGPEAINPTGQGTEPGDPGAIDVFGFYDAWDVPLDYLLYVKVEYGMQPNSVLPHPVWMTTDRVPVLRSRGISAEEAAHGAVDPQRAIYTVAFPQPAANVDPHSGVFLTPPCNGWSRALAGGQPNNEDTWDDYNYVPEQ